MALCAAVWSWRQYTWPGYAQYERGVDAADCSAEALQAFRRALCLGHGNGSESCTIASLEME